MDLYREEILDHFKHPRNWGKLKQADGRAKETNASCGDIMEMEVKMKADKIEKIKFQGEGCAISMAAGSMLTEMVEGKEKKEVEKMDDETMLKRLGIKVSVTRRKCVSLGLVTLKKALEEYGKKK